AGSDPLLDEAIARYPALEQFLRQGMYEAETFGVGQSKFSGMFETDTENRV
ncbi:MAG: hypothetical protein WC298_03760, partial [Sideroxydans sp.]